MIKNVPSDQSFIGHSNAVNVEVA